MLFKVVRYATGAVAGVPKQDSEERLPRNCRDKGRLEVHILLGLLTDEDIQSFHMRSKGRVYLSFLLPNESCSGDNNSCPWYEAGAVEHGLVILCALPFAADGLPIPWFRPQLNRECGAPPYVSLVVVS